MANGGLRTIDGIIMILYFIGMLLVGFYYYRKRETADQFLVAKRNTGFWVVGASAAATDLGGGFTVGLGGLGFTMGLSASWLLFTGLVGAWIAAILIVPRIKRFGDRFKAFTFPDFLAQRFDEKARIVAAIVSGLSYAGFVGGQMVASGKLASAALNISFNLATFGAGIVVVLYTMLGGLESVMMTDFLQWIIMAVGLIGLSIPIALHAVGGWGGLQAALPASYFSLGNLTMSTWISWMLSIVPIWFIAMTLYQRIYAAKDVKTARKAFIFTGLIEYPLFAFGFAILGMCARVLFPQADSEMAMPLMVKQLLPPGILGIVLAAYFAATMSTAASCIMVPVGNITHDIYRKFINPQASDKTLLLLNRVLVAVIGLGSIVLAVNIPFIIKLILYAYTFLAAGLFFPTILGLLWKRATAAAAFWAMMIPGVAAIVWEVMGSPNGIPSIYIGLPLSLVLMIVISLLTRHKADEDIESFFETTRGTISAK